MISFPSGLYSDVRIEDIHECEINIIDGELADYRQRAYRAAFVRLYDGNRWYYETLTELDALQETLDRLAALATVPTDESIDQDPIVKAFEVNTGKELNFVEDDVALVDNSRKRSLIESYAALVDGNDAFKSWRASYDERRERKHFISSKGADIEFDSQRCGVILGGDLVGSEGRKHRDGFTKAGTRFADISDLRAEIEGWLATATDYLERAVPVEPGTYPVVLSPEAAGVFAHECFGHKSEADFMLGDESARREWAIGTTVGASELTIIDDGRQAGSGYVPFDDEGTKAQATTLIDHGVLAGRLHSATTAASLEEGPTGNARAMSFKFEPIPRMTTTYIGAGELTKEELIAKVQNGIYVEAINHGSGMSTFTLAPKRAYRIVDGVIAEPVKVSVVTGKVFQALKEVRAVSNEVEILSFVGGGCGKMEQMPLPVGFGGPYVLVDNLDVR